MKLGKRIEGRDDSEPLSKWDMEIIMLRAWLFGMSALLIGLCIVVFAALSEGLGALLVDEIGRDEETILNGNTGLSWAIRIHHCIFCSTEEMDSWCFDGGLVPAGIGSGMPCFLSRR